MPPPAFIKQLNLGPITAYAFNGDRTQVAVSKNSNVVDIYSTNGANWVKTASLTDHDKLVTSIDWAPRTNRIVTCSQDRNAYVFTPNADGSWRPTLVLLRMNRSGTYVRWSPNEDKFAVASGARLISVCFFEEENDWWISKHLRRPIRSTVLSLDWHPNNVLLAAGCSDMSARVFSAYIKEVDDKPAPTVWGSRLPFNTVCAEYLTNGWVHEVKFSPDGNALAFCSHDSCLTVVYPSEPEQPPAAIYQVKFPILPFRTLVWLTENKILAAGDNCEPVILKGDASNGWILGASIDDSSSRTSSAMDKSDTESVGFSSLRQTFRNMDLRGTSDEAALPTVHQNTIVSLRVYAGSAEHVTQVSSAGIDGKLCVWNV